LKGSASLYNGVDLYVKEVFQWLPKFKRDTSANWTKNNPVILNGEIILVDTAEGELRAKIGDGTKTYTQLPFSDEVLKSLINTVANNSGKSTVVMRTWTSADV
jgi:hypothetical protein